MEKFICEKCLKIITKEYKNNNRACECGSETCFTIECASKKMKEMREAIKVLRSCRW
ncbi:MAG: hypothetical protein WBG30_13205 [Psychrilyobacter sp.]|uniref:hypothetical protein n=1 Tax=Psychrilyobacter sp. TaxID=2586924 RepID=UPI003C724029